MFSHQVAERGIHLAALLGNGVVFQQALPELAAQVVDGGLVDDPQAQALLERRVIQGLTGQQAAGERQDFRARGYVEQRRAARFSGQVPRSRLATSTGAAWAFRHSRQADNKSAIRTQGLPLQSHRPS